jgi:Zn-dependent M16 (insulinase) family peptidase
VLPTEEAHERVDKGLPHTLEHLVFMGSETYPYKGVLDTLANRARASGTNAWTATDHTAYTSSHAGSAGFCALLPIYLDHILYPTLTDSAFVTEVYHVTGKGEDGGVVYSEMQGRENSADDLVSHRQNQLLYPGGACGYASETGGKMCKLRELDNQQIKHYHTAYYRPDNLCLIITGKINHTDVFVALDAIEKKAIQRKSSLPPFQRPWMASGSTLPSPPKESVSEILEFPDEDESSGSVWIGCRGPPITDAFALAQLDTLLMYLTDSPVAVLQKEFVECEDPLATDVGYQVNGFKDVSFLFYLTSVDAEDLDDVEAEFVECLSQHKINMKQLRTTIELRRLRKLSYIESDTGNAIAEHLITHFLYGDRSGQDLLNYVDDDHHTESLMNTSEETWAKLLKAMITDAPRVTLRAKPSCARMRQITEEEGKRVAERQKNATELEMAKKKLESAISQNNTPIPKNLIGEFPIPVLNAKMPDIATAQFPKTLPAAELDSDLQSKLESEVASNFPFFIQLDHVKSQFVTLQLSVDTTNLSEPLRKYLTVYLELFFSSPLQKSDLGVAITHEDVVNQLNMDTVEHGVGCGQGAEGGASLACGAYDSQLNIEITVLPEKYTLGVTWVKRLLMDLEFDWTRIQTVVGNMVSDLPELKRDAMQLTSWTSKSLIFDARSNHRTFSIQVQSDFLCGLDEKATSRDISILNDLHALRNALIDPGLMRIHLRGELSKLGVAQLVSPWKSWNLKPSSTQRTEVPSPITFLTPLGKGPNSINGRGKLIRLPSTESGYFFAISNGPAGPMHPDVPALSIAFEYFSTMEGLFWNQIRGPGLAYGCSVSLDAITGHVNLVIYRATDVVSAVVRARTIVEEVVEGKIALDPELINSARASVAFKLVSREEYPRDAAVASYVSSVLHQCNSARYNREMLKKLESVTIADVQRVIGEYLPPVFDAEKSLMIAVAGPAKYDEIHTRIKCELRVCLHRIKFDEDEN